MSRWLALGIEAQSLTAMKILILGGSGMLGHKLWQTLAPRFETHVTLRGRAADFGRLGGVFDQSQAVGGLDAESIQGFAKLVQDLRPDVVVNCIGVVKQDPAAHNPVATIGINALFPHRMAAICKAARARFIHLSTDCVFSGSKGSYTEDDLPDATDLYGRGTDNLTIRTSMIGRELRGTHGLLEWFLSQEGGRVRGFKRAVFSGFTTGALSEVLARIIAEHPGLNGVWHVASDPINKFDLLSLIKESYGISLEIGFDESFVCDRSLNGSRFRLETGIQAPSWPAMIADLRRDPTPYEDIRRMNDS